MNRTLLAVVATVALAGCEGTHDLDDRHCLPLAVPGDVSLERRTVLYTVDQAPPLILADADRNRTNDDFLHIKEVGALPAGTRLRITHLRQRWGFDSGLGRISAFGTTARGDAFEYAWGAGTTLGRAPWEPESTPPTRTVDCGR